ncbi:n-alkane-inducible cytochrome P450 [Lophiotrema nucula]|uniref:N-alkane-inducible cytochrome P450 n=1 Tax=Lophiotrema nucula TaxID=690887 RepID=A0A6A5ZV82_9PLEO|nr:n-alkane-inducible cytochrome P450 [Lophiotrema nucula]
MALVVWLLGIPVVLVLQLLFDHFRRRVAISDAAKRYGAADPPSLPSKDPVFGSDNVRFMMQQMAKDRRIKSIYEQLHTYGFTFQSWPFGKRVVSTVDPRNIQFVFATEAENFGVGPQRENAQSPMTGKGLITSDDPMWSKMRPLIRPTFTRTQINDKDVFNVHVTRFLNLLPTDGSKVNLRPLFERLILDASSEFIFGETFGSQLSDCKLDAQRFIDSFNYAQKGVGKRVMFGKMSFLIHDPKFWESCHFVQDYTRHHVDQALRQRKKAREAGLSEDDPVNGKYILVHELAKETDDRDVLCSQLLNVFFAGRDTPAVALTNIFFSLARNPGVWMKIREEVEGLEPDDLTFEKLKSLRYMQHAINEGMRLYPPVANNSRVCLKTTRLPTGGGADGRSPICVFPGDTISMSFFTLHRRADLYDDPEEFKPERWQTIRPTWEFLPFGGGARHCPAQQLALFWVAYVLVRMALKFKELKNMDLVDGFVEDLKLNMESKNGAKVSLVCA